MRICFTALISLVALVPALAADEQAKTSGRSAIPVILDTDIGTDIDDTWALGLLLKSPELDPKLVLGDWGRTDYRARLIAKFLQTVGRTDVPVGVGLNIPRPKGDGNLAAWVGDYKLTEYPGTVYSDGVQALIDVIMKSDHIVTLICIGPLPNIAEALRREPRIAQHARFVGMQGSLRKVYAESNVKNDPKSFREALAAPWDVTITPLDTCGLVKLTGEKFQRIRTSSDPIAVAIMANYRVWVAKRYPSDTAQAETSSSTLFDTVAVCLAIREDFFNMEKLGVRVSDDGFTVIDVNSPKVNAATSWKNLDAFEDFLVGRLTHGR